MTEKVISSPDTRLHNLFSWLRKDPQQEILILLFLAILALVPRLVRLDSVPPGLDGDEVFNAIDALRLGWDNLQLYFEGNNGREALFLYLMALSLKVFGQSVFAVRLPAVLLGTGSVLLAYGLGRNEFGRRVGLIAGVLMALSIWPVMHSRWGLRAVSLTFFTALTVYLYGRAFREEGKKIFWWIAAGVALGLTMYTYIPSRTFPLVIIGYFVWFAVTHRNIWRQLWPKYLLTLLVALVVYAPFGRYMIQNPDKVNQRISSVSGANAWLKALDGEPAALLETVSSVLLMFNVSGDTAIRYHVDTRPVFDPLTGLIFLVGLIATFWLAFTRRSENRAAYGLLLLWMGAMLAPNAILGSDTSFLRAAGAIVPVYLVAAIGLDTIYRWLIRQWPKRETIWRLGLVVLIAAGSLATLADTWSAYFVTWPDEPVVREVYNGGLARIGDYLNHNPPPGEVEIMIAYDYVSDTTPQSFAYYSDEDVTWFSNQNTFSWRPTSQKSYYFVPYNKPLVQEATEMLDYMGKAEVLAFANGDPAFTLYKVDNIHIDWLPQNELDLWFEDGPQLMGFDISKPLYRGESARINLHWKITANQQPLPNRLTFAQVFLEDADGNIWQQAGSLLGYPEAGWRPGDRFNHFLSMEIPPGMPPGPAYLRFGLRDWTGSPFTIEKGSDLFAEPFILRSRPAEDVTLAADTPVFGDLLALSGHAFSSLIAPGLPLDIALEWLALGNPAANYKVRFELTQPGTSEPFLSQDSGLWPGRYPSSEWQEGEQITTFHRLHIPLELPTNVNPILKIRMLQEETNQALPLSQGHNILAELTLSLREHNFKHPEISQPYEAQFGDQIRLLGYDLDLGNNRPSGEMYLTLYWQAIETPGDSYTVFNHVVDDSGQIQGQFDSPPVGDAWLTSTWLPGEIIVEQRTIPIRPGAAAGPHSLSIGLYDSSDGLRLPVHVDGQPQPQDQLILGEIAIRP